MTDSSDFIYPFCGYYNSFKSDNILFNTKLQELTRKVNYICFLEMTGQISTEVSYQEIQIVWHQVEQQKNLLDISHFMQGLGSNSEAQ